MKTAIKILILVLLFVTAIISIHDYFRYKEKQKLYARSSMYDEGLVAFSKVLIEMQQLGEKYIIFKSRKINDETRKTLLKEIEEFLKKSEKVGIKFSNLLKSYNSIVSEYNNLPKQIFWYKNLLPRTLEVKTKEDYLQLMQAEPQK
ncbi:MAG: hypothetical protein PVF26_13640 [Desulfobacterales bacterium]|jgi:hypothetical protein